MKKLLLFFIFCLLFNGLHAQWLKDSTLAVPGGVGLFDMVSMKIPNDSTIWGLLNYDNNISVNSSIYFERTTNGGKSWDLESVSNLLSNKLTDCLAPIDNDTCYASAFDNYSGDGAIYKTIDGGHHWVQLDSGMIFKNGYPDFIYFWNANEGIVLGDPNGPGIPYFEIYKTYNGGATWSRIDRANIPASLSEAGLTDQFAVQGDDIWFISALSHPQRMFHSSNKGVDWVASEIADYVTHDSLNYVNSIDFDFCDAQHGLVISRTNQIFSTADGGLTWHKVNYTGSLQFGYLSAIPGTYTFVSADAGTSYSIDYGNTWVTIDSLPTHDDTKFYNNTIGWSGAPMPGGSAFGNIYQWAGSPLNTNIIHAANFQAYTSPNPAPDKTLLVFNSERAATYEATVTDITGKELAHMPLTTVTGQNKFNIDLKGFAPGLYFITLKNKNEIKSIKFIKG